MKYLYHLYGQYNKSKKSIKMAAIYKLQVRITKFLMYIHGGHMCICVPNMKFLCLTLYQWGCAQTTTPIPMTMMLTPTMTDKA